jgi:hypothetical protein
MWLKPSKGQGQITEETRIVAVTVSGIAIGGPRTLVDFTVIFF